MLAFRIRPRSFAPLGRLIAAWPRARARALWAWALCALVLPACAAPSPNRVAGTAARPAVSAPPARPRAPQKPLIPPKIGRPNPYAVPCPDLDCFMRRLPRPVAEAARPVLSEIEPKDSVIAAVERPSTATATWTTFAKNNASDAKADQAAAFYRRNAAVFDEVERRFGVEKEVILAILAVETNMGRNMGSYRAVDALTTLSFHHPRRQAMFQDELSHLLRLSYALGRDPGSFKSSYAGAMGMPQFMPTSYEYYAVDFDGDGFADIWSNPGDVAASVANYLRYFRWRRGEPISLPVRRANPQAPLKDLGALIDKDTDLQAPLAALRFGYGLDFIPVPGIDENTEFGFPYALRLDSGESELRVGLYNFMVIWQYNRSRLYVSAVERLAEKIRARIGARPAAAAVPSPQP